MPVGYAPADISSRYRAQVAAVLHYVERWLEISAGFVHAQVSASRHGGVVVSRDARQNRAAYPYRPVRRLNWLHALTPERYWPVARRRALRLIAEAYRIDVLHAHFGFAAGDLVPLAGRTGRPLVVSLHGYDATALPGLVPGIYQPLIPAVRAVVVPSRFLAEVVADLGFPAERIHIIPSGVDVSFFAPSPLPAGLPRVAFVGRLVEKKGVDVLLAAWPAVRRAVPEARLHLLGTGPLAERIPADDPSVVHEGPDPTRRREQVRTALQAATVVATPSRTAADGDAESLLLVNLEAQAVGRPVVTTRHGGIPEFVADGVTALLVPEADPGALSTALIRVLTDRALAERMGAAGPTHAARWPISQCANRMDDLYDELAAQRSRPEPPR